MGLLRHRVLALRRSAACLHCSTHGRNGASERTPKAAALYGLRSTRRRATRAISRGSRARAVAARQGAATAAAGDGTRRATVHRRERVAPGAVNASGGARSWSDKTMGA